MTLSHQSVKQSGDLQESGNTTRQVECLWHGYIDRVIWPLLQRSQHLQAQIALGHAKTHLLLQILMTESL